MISAAHASPHWPARVHCRPPTPIQHVVARLHWPGLYSLADSATVPTLSRSLYFSRTFALWYFQNDLLASLPAMRFRILVPPGCSSTKPIHLLVDKRLSIHTHSTGKGPANL